MPSNEIKRQFTLGKMEKDKDDRLVEPGSYRDALDVDVARSEGDDSGALQVTRGNREPVNQNIDWERRGNEADPTQTFEEYTELVKPFGETVGTYAYPQEEKLYFFNTGRPVDPDNPDVEQPLQNAIYEYDQVNNVVSPILIETDRGDFEAGGGATQEFIGELMNSQVWGKASYQSDTDQTDTPFLYTKSPSTADSDFALVTLTCSSQNVIERDNDDNPVCRTGGACDGDVCECGTNDCLEVLLFFEAADGELVCRVGGDPAAEVCTCGSEGCDYVQLACNAEGGLTRTEEDCSSVAGSINDDINYEAEDNIIVEYNGEEYPTEDWLLSGDPDLDIQYQTITQFDLDNSSCFTGIDNTPLGDVKFTLNGNGSETQPEEFCDPRCTLFDPYPEYCIATPVLDSLYDTQLTDEAIASNRQRILTLTNVAGVGDGEQITVTIKRLIPDSTTLAAEFDSANERYNFTEPENNGRGIFDADNAVVLRGLNALDFQQLDQIFGNVGLASRQVGYTYRVARNGNVSWVPNSDDVFQAFGTDDTNDVLAELDPNNNAIPAGGENAQNLTFNVEVDRQQEYGINTDDQSDDVHDPNSDRYIDDNTRE